MLVNVLWRTKSPSENQSHKTCSPHIHWPRGSCSRGQRCGVLGGSAMSHTGGGGASLVSSQENKQEVGIARRDTRKDSTKQLWVHGIQINKKRKKWKKERSHQREGALPFRSLGDRVTYYKIKRYAFIRRSSFKKATQFEQRGQELSTKSL